MKLFLGVDGGGTKTETLICDEEGNITGRHIGGQSNPLFIEKENLLETIRESLRVIVQDSGRKDKIDYAAVCITGIRKYKSEVEAEYSKYCKEVDFIGEELNAFRSAVSKPYGIVVLSGTGSFAMGINRKGEQCKFGGWGPVLGDEGSGYFIGVSCLKAVIKEYEGFGTRTALTPKIKDFFCVKEVPELRNIVYSKECDRRVISSLSKIVHESAAEGDSISLEIINEAAKYLADLTDRIVRRLNMYDGEYDVVLTGGISNFGELILKPFNEEVKRHNMNLNVKNAKLRPSVGSLLVAMEKSGINIYNEKILKNLNDSYIKCMTENTLV